METQIQEVQAALAWNHMVQQEITDRAEKVEKALGFIEENMQNLYYKLKP